MEQKGQTRLQKWQIPLGQGWSQVSQPDLPCFCFRLEGEWLVGKRLSTLAARPPIEEIEAERPLYLRLADATVLCEDGDVRMQPRWREMAVDFSNLWEPPLRRRDTDSRRSQLRVPVEVFAEEALMMAWALQLKERLLDVRQYTQPYPAVVAAVQVNGLLSADYESDRERGGPVPSGPEYRPLATAKTVANDFFGIWNRQGLDMKAMGWRYAASALSAAVFEKTKGVTPYAEAAHLRRGAIRFNSGFIFTRPLSRIWFGFWEALGGVRHGCCPKCGSWFTTGRLNKRYCSKRCQNAAKVENYRKQRAGAGESK